MTCPSYSTGVSVGSGLALSSPLQILQSGQRVDGVHTHRSAAEIVDVAFPAPAEGVHAVREVLEVVNSSPSGHLVCGLVCQSEVAVKRKQSDEKYEEGEQAQSKDHQDGIT
eukprot:TRINITY_DN492_c0_g1_i1.p4 TRINITY_DN492_c0_g1~~TRINITY_DN492_c0_g1_i1.p4  ORF type:complete len:111 (-),score=11.80 TRINITY_DN492_c0_g1_i1:722-1054(-)